jgi:biopolymer transport protein ExbD
LIRKKKEFNPDLRVVIRADRNAKYQYVRSIMVAMGQAGVPNVTFSAVDKELQKKP